MLGWREAQRGHGGTQRRASSHARPEEGGLEEEEGHRPANGAAPSSAGAAWPRCWRLWKVQETSSGLDGPAHDWKGRGAETEVQEPSRP